MPTQFDTQNIAMLEQFGSPTKDWQGNKTYTLPDGTKMVYTENGDFVSKTLPTELSNDYFPNQKAELQTLRNARTQVAKGESIPENYKSMYSARDQQLIERYEASRSEIAADPELDENERQIALDKIDARIDAVPHISPIMREPSAQEKFQASIVVDPETKLRGTIDKNGKFNAIEADTMTQKKQEVWNERFYKNLDNLREDNSDPMAVMAQGGTRLDDSHMVQKAKLMTDMEQGISSPEPEVIKPLDAAWQVVMTDLYHIGGMKKQKANEKVMVKAMDKYIQIAINKSNGQINHDQAKADFIKRWQYELGGGPYQDVVADMDDELRHKAQVALVNPIRGDIPYGFDNDPNEAKQNKPNQEAPTPGELKSIGTEEAYNTGVKLGYWK